jgi:hypothetical protein
MKTLIALFSLMLLATSADIQAQQGQRKGQGPKLSIDERVDRVTTRLYVALELNDEQMKQTKAVMRTHMEEVEKLREEADGRPDLELVGKSMNKRDAEFKKIFTEQQFAKYEQMKDDIYNRRMMRKEQRKGKRGGGNGG